MLSAEQEKWLLSLAFSVSLSFPSTRGATEVQCRLSFVYSQGPIGHS